MPIFSKNDSAYVAALVIAPLWKDGPIISHKQQKAKTFFVKNNKKSILNYNKRDHHAVAEVGCCWSKTMILKA